MVFGATRSLTKRSTGGLGAVRPEGEVLSPPPVTFNVIWLNTLMATVDENTQRTCQSATVLTVAISAVLVFVTLVALLWWFAFGHTTGATSIPPVSETIPTTEPDEATSAALIVLDGATQVRRDPGAYWSYHVAYAINEKYPAPNAVQQLSSRLKTLGWTPLRDDWLNPGLPSSHVNGWTDFIDGTTTPMNHVHQWGAQWKDKNGNIIDYTLRYSYPESGTPNLQSLWVNGSWYPAASAKIMQAP